jgi:hypothetical protein
VDLSRAPEVFFGTSSFGSRRLSASDATPTVRGIELGLCVMGLAFLRSGFWV